MSEQKFDYQAYFNDVFRVIERMQEIFEEKGAHSEVYARAQAFLKSKKPEMSEEERIKEIREMEKEIYKGFPGLQSNTNFQIGTNGAIGVVIYDNPHQTNTQILLLQTPLGNVDLSLYFDRNSFYPGETRYAHRAIGAEFNIAELAKNRCITYACITKLPWKPNTAELPSPEWPDMERTMPKETVEAIYKTVLENYRNGIDIPVYLDDERFKIAAVDSSQEKGSEISNKPEQQTMRESLKVNPVEQPKIPGTTTEKPEKTIQKASVELAKQLQAGQALNRAQQEQVLKAVNRLPTIPNKMGNQGFTQSKSIMNDGTLNLPYILEQNIGLTEAQKRQLRNMIHSQIQEL